MDDTALEQDGGLSRVHELARGVSIYHNRGDMARVISDYTKGNPECLGSGGAARPSLLHNKVQQLACTPLVSGLVEHSYYLSGCINTAIRQSIDNVPYNDPQRRRSRDLALPNVWKMR